MDEEDKRIILLRKARDFAREKHKGQLDDNGENYYGTHLSPVMCAISELTSDIDIIRATVLHDTLEDTDTTYEELVREFGKRVADLVMEVTHEGKKDGYGYYFPRLKTAGGIMIKLCDRASNISRMQTWNRHRKQQYLKKTKFWKDSPSKPKTK